MSNERIVQTLNMLNNGSGKGMTDLANIIVSREAPNLIKMGLITFARNNWSGYKLTKQGKSIVKLT